MRSRNVLRDDREGVSVLTINRPERLNALGAGQAACLASVTRGLDVSIHEGLTIEASQFGRVAATHDVREGIQAFIEKRRPVFTGT